MNKLKIMAFAVLCGCCMQSCAVSAENSYIANPEKFCMGLLDNSGFAHLKQSLIEPARDLKMAMGLALRENYRALIDKAMYKTKSQLANFDNLKYRNSVYNVILTEIQRAVLNLDIYRNGSVKYNQCNYDDPKNANQILKLDAADGFLQFSAKYQRSHLNYVFLINLIDRSLNSTKNVNQDLLSEISQALHVQGLDIELIGKSYRDISQYCKELGLYDYLKNLRGAHDIAKGVNEATTKVNKHPEHRVECGDIQALETYYSKIENFVEKLPGANNISRHFYYMTLPDSFDESECPDPHVGPVYMCAWKQDYSHRDREQQPLEYTLDIREPSQGKLEVDLDLSGLGSKSTMQNCKERINNIKDIISQTAELSAIKETNDSCQRKIDSAVTRIINIKTQEASNSPNRQKSVTEALDNLYNVSGVIECKDKCKVFARQYKYISRYWVTDLNRPVILPPSQSVIKQKLDELKKMMNAKDLVSCIKKEYEDLFHEKFEDINEGEITKYSILFD